MSADFYKMGLIVSIIKLSLKYMNCQLGTEKYIDFMLQLNKDMETSYITKKFI